MEEQQEEEQQKLAEEKNLVITAAEKNLVMTDSCAAEAKVGSLVPSEWVQEREFSASKTGEEVVVGDLVVVMRSPEQASPSRAAPRPTEPRHGVLRAVAAAA